ncbi:heavy-metal-associated domain-containing protein [Oceanisphaera psychrotolerans]|nr:heavy-metal-associated domain-containing protein [Oceanisphaera psychrotolerans]
MTKPKEDTTMISFTLPEMTCGHCVGVINQTLIELDPECELEFDLLNHIIKVESSCTREQLAEALTEAGYQPA